MKILLIGEYSNVHNTLAKGLRVLGHKAVSYTHLTLPTIYSV